VTCAIEDTVRQFRKRERMTSMTIESQVIYAKWHCSTTSFVRYKHHTTAFTLADIPLYFSAILDNFC